MYQVNKNSEDSHKNIHDYVRNTSERLSEYGSGVSM